MRRTLAISIICLISILTLSCTKESEKTTFSSQESKIESFVNSTLASDESYRATNNKGSIRITLAEGSGEALTENGIVSLYYAGYVFNGSSLSTSNLFATNDEVFANSIGWVTNNPEQYNILTITLSDNDIVTGLRNGLKGAKAGEECIVIFSGKHGFGDKQLGMIPANSALAYHIKVESIANN